MALKRVSKKASKKASKKVSRKTSKKVSKKVSKKKTSKKKSSKKKSKTIIVLEKDILGKYGYHNVHELTKKQRELALTKALKNKDNKPLSIYRRLIALATLNKNKDIKLHDIFRTDAEWLKNHKLYK